MKVLGQILISLMATTLLVSYAPSPEAAVKTAADILGNPDYPAISFGAYREKTREIQPTIPQLKEDLKILSAMGITCQHRLNCSFGW